MSESEIELSGLYYPNKFARIFLEKLWGFLGEERFGEVLTTAGIPQYIGNLPPDNLEREFDFAHFSVVNMAIDTLYGERSYQVISRQVGRKCFSLGLRYFGALGGIC